MNHRQELARIVHALKNSLLPALPKRREALQSMTAPVLRPLIPVAKPIIDQKIETKLPVKPTTAQPTPKEAAVKICYQEKLLSFYNENGFPTLQKSKKSRKGFILAGAKNDQEHSILQNLSHALKDKEGFSIHFMQDNESLETTLKESSADWILATPQELLKRGVNPSPKALLFEVPIILLDNLSLYNHQPSLKRALWNKLTLPR